MVEPFTTTSMTIDLQEDKEGGQILFREKEGWENLASQNLK